MTTCKLKQPSDSTTIKFDMKTMYFFFNFKLGFDYINFKASSIIILIKQIRLMKLKMQQNPGQNNEINVLFFLLFKKTK